jgi:hypothetical protein
MSAAQLPCLPHGLASTSLPLLPLYNQCRWCTRTANVTCVCSTLDYAGMLLQQLCALQGSLTRGIWRLRRCSAELSSAVTV